MFSEEKLPQAHQKQQQIGIKSCYSNASYRFEYKNYISKLSSKMFIKRKTRAGKVFDYRVHPSFKTFVTYKKN